MRQIRGTVGRLDDRHPSSGARGRPPATTGAAPNTAKTSAITASNGNRSRRWCIDVLLGDVGHATHHVIYFDERSGAAWIGDTGGVCRPGAAVARPATPPPDIDIEAWQRALDMLRALNPSVLLLTHFGPAYQPSAYIEDYRATLLHWADTVRIGLLSGADQAAQIAQLDTLAQASLGPNASDEDATLYEQASSTALSWHGLARYWRKRIEQA
jgi:hypothetical protein